ncbi:hypothetical protein AAAC51_29005 [Priestia megaterium]
MLQRLFNLEQYGDQLSKKIRYQVQQLKTDLDKITAEQTGLGEASTEKVTEAEQLVSDSIILLEKREKKRLICRKDTISRRLFGKRSRKKH